MVDIGHFHISTLDLWDISNPFGPALSQKGMLWISTVVRSWTDGSAGAWWEALIGWTGYWLTHLGAPAQQLWSKVDCAGPGGWRSRRRKKEQQRWVRIVKKTHTGTHKCTHAGREYTEVREIEDGTMTSCQRYRILFPTINPLFRGPVIQSTISSSLFQS